MMRNPVLRRAVPKFELVITPAALKVRFRLLSRPKLRFGWFKMLNASVRNWILRFSVNLNVLNSDRSVLKKPGPNASGITNLPLWPGVGRAKQPGFRY